MSLPSSERQRDTVCHTNTLLDLSLFTPPHAGMLTLGGTESTSEEESGRLSCVDSEEESDAGIWGSGCSSAGDMQNIGYSEDDDPIIDPICHYNAQDALKYVLRLEDAESKSSSKEE